MLKYAKIKWFFEKIHIYILVLIVMVNQKKKIDLVVPLMVGW
jgi:hypothetical protein